MKEIEVKILEVNKEKLEKRIRDLWGFKIFSGTIITYYFDYDNNQLEKEGKVLRLRDESGKITLTLKEGVSREKAKIMDEYEVRLGDFELMRDLLVRLGLKEKQKIEKHRTSYVLNEVHIEIDTHPDIPTFIEIEAPSIEELKEYVEKLGFKMEDTKPWSVWDVLEYYGKK